MEAAEKGGVKYIWFGKQNYQQRKLSPNSHSIDAEGDFSPQKPPFRP
jgi:hypothetical protein